MLEEFYILCHQDSDKEVTTPRGKIFALFVLYQTLKISATKKRKMVVFYKCYFYNIIFKLPNIQPDVY